MGTIIKIIKFIIVSVLAIVYWPLNFLFLKIKDKYLLWKDEDRISFIIATPLYYFFFLIVGILSYILETLGTELKPQIGTFQ